ncbi:MAG: low temperature requirement protein A [Hyphomicrobiaceae bacterium]
MRAVVERFHLPARDPNESHRTATQLELFFDLVTVIAIASVTAALHHAISEGHGLEGLPRFLFLFTAIWWAWINFTWFASAFDNDGPVYRLLVMLIMLGELIFAGGTAHIFETLDFQWALGGWCLMRVGMAALWLRASANPEFKTTCRRYAAGIVFAQLCWIALYFLVEPASVTFYAAGMLCFLIEFAVPPLAESARVTPFHRHHIVERYGLLAIISMGEIMLSISAGFGRMYGEHPDLAPGGSALAAFLIVFALFWVYFTEREHLASSRFWTAFIWGYGHVFVFGGIAALGAALAAEIDIVGGHGSLGSGGVSLWLGLPMTIVLLALWVTRDRYHSLGWRQPALPVMSAAALLAGVAGASIWVFSVIMIVALVWRVPLSEDPKAGAH